MAEGDGQAYGVFKQKLFEKRYDLSSGGDSIKVALVLAYTPIYHTHNLWTDVTAASTELSGAGYTAGGDVLAGQTVTETGTGTTVKGKWDATDLTWTGLDAGTPTHAIIYDDTLTTPADELICAFEVTTPSNGGDYTLAWNANGICRIS